ncbi:MAG: GNAT family N-acetyltransferase [Actinomycetota bacterium]
MEVRRADEGDLADIAQARLSNGPAHDDSGANPDYCRYLIRCGHLVVAEQGGRVVGFGGAIDIAGARLLSDLYVHADWHGKGVGGALLGAVLDGAFERLTFASNDPATIPLYTRAGMLCHWPLLTLGGAAAGLSEPHLAEPHLAESLLPGSHLLVREVDALDAASVEQGITGIDRVSDHVYWRSRAGSHAVSLELDGRVTAVGALLVSDGGCRIEHLAAIEGFELAAVAALTRWSGAKGVQLYVPGNHELAAHLLQRGFRVTDTGLHMSTTTQAVHPRLCVLHPGLC